MKHPEIYLETTIEDIIFEGRNHDYGAYQLRKDTNRFLKLALLIGCMFVTIISAFSLTNKPAPIVKKPVDVYDTTIVIIDPVLFPPPPVIEQPVPAAPIAAQQMLAEFVPVDNADPAAVDENPHIDELLPDVPIGLHNIEGPTGPKIIDRQPDIAGIGAGNKEKEFTLFAEQMPEFIGGLTAMQKWMAHEIDYPEMAVENQIEGTVYVSFIVNLDGSITNVKVERGIGFGCDEEAVRAVKAMPNWIPGKQNNVAVRVKQTIPIKFEIRK